MPKWVIVAVVGRPSAYVSDFFNSIKFHTDYVEAANYEEAIGGDPKLPPGALDQGYTLMNWYAFEDKEMTT